MTKTDNQSTKNIRLFSSGVEQNAENVCVGGSNPSGATQKSNTNPILIHRTMKKS